MHGPVDFMLLKVKDCDVLFMVAYLTPSQALGPPLQ